MKKKKVLLLITLFLILISCTKKRNILGGSDINLNFKTYITDNNKSAIKDSLYSFEDTTKTYYSSNDFVFMGEKDNKKAYALFRFVNFPKKIKNINSAKIKLNYSKYNNENTLFKVAKINKTWVESQVNINQAYNDNEWNFFESIEELENLSIISDTTNITIENTNSLKSLVEEWVSSDSLKNGICIFPKTFNNKLFSLYSSEKMYDTENRYNISPSLVIEYLNEEEDTKIDTIYASYDNFVIDNIYPSKEIKREITISNINPQYSIFDLDFSSEILDTENQLKEEELKKITINKAELILNVEDSFHLNDLFTFYPAIVNKEFNFDYQLPFDKSFIEKVYPIVYSYIKENENQIKINVTSIIQGFVSKKIEKRPLIIVPSHKNKNFNTFKFYDNSASDSTLKPKLKIIYTLPNF